MDNCSDHIACSQVRKGKAHLSLEWLYDRQGHSMACRGNLWFSQRKRGKKRCYNMGMEARYQNILQRRAFSPTCNAKSTLVRATEEYSGKGRRAQWALF